MSRQLLRRCEPSSLRSAAGWAMLLLLSMATASASAARQESTADPSQAAEPPGTGSLTSLHGTVLNAITHQPIGRALVSLNPFGSSMLTDNEGRFSFTGVPPGTLIVQARRPGFGGDEPGSTLSSSNVSVAAPGSDVTLELTPMSSIAGEVLLSGEDAVDSLQVQLLNQQVENGHARWAFFRNADVRSDGRFRFGNLPAGPYLVHTSASIDPVPAEEPPGAHIPRSGYVPAFYPGVRELAGAAVIRLNPGQQVEIRLPLAREAFYRATLPVANGGVSQFISFTVTNDSFLGLPARYAPDDGLVHMELPSGHYRLEGRSYEQHPLSGIREFDVNEGGVRAAPIVLLPVNRIPVTVHEELTHMQASSPRMPPGDDVRLPSATDKLNLRLDPVNSNPESRGPSASLQEDRAAPGSDHAVLENVLPGRYWVEPQAFSGYVAAATSGGVNLLEEPLTVAADGSASPIEVTVRDDTASLSVGLASSLRAGNAQPHLYLELLPQSGAAVERTVSFNADGTAQLSDLPPGNYLAFASPTRQRIVYRDASTMAGLAGKGQAVTLEPGGTVHITLGSLLQAGGAAAEGAQ